MANQPIKSDRDDDLVEGSPNRDPLTGEKGAHPVGVGLGAAGAGAAGAMAGAVGGPVGMAVGAVVGAVVGGLAGKGVAEAVDPTVEDTYWRENHASRPYYETGKSYDDYAPAYRLGWETRNRGEHSTFEAAESHLARDWDKVKAKSSLTWDKAKHASHDAWKRVESATVGK